jgi:tryptophanyl-tRNA synthetase
MSDSEEDVNRKVKNMFTDPTKIQRTDPGHPETCPVCQLQVVYTPDYQKYHQLEREGSAEWGCVKNKKLLAECINKALAPVRAKREELLRDRRVIEEILQEGAKKARRAADETLTLVREAMKIGIR